MQPSFLFPPLETIKFNPITAVLSVGLAALGIFLAWQYYAWRRSPFMGLTERSAFFAWCHRAMQNKYGLDVLYSDWIAGTVKGSIAAGANWFNQRIIDAVPNGAGKGAVATGRVVYGDFDQKVLDGVIVASGGGAEASGQALSHIQTGKVQQYAALLFAAAAILAVIFVFAT